MINLLINLIATFAFVPMVLFGTATITDGNSLTLLYWIVLGLAFTLMII